MLHVGGSLLQWDLMALDAPLVHAPVFQSGPWINAPSPPNWLDSSAQALVVSFLDFTCINCLRTLPYLRAWHRMYAPHMSLIAVHTPEFSFAHDPDWVAQAAGRLGVRWPILMDNQQTHWTAWAVHGWPTLFVIDRDGFIRLAHAGDRGYSRIETALRNLVQQALPLITLPTPLGLVRQQDEPNAVCMPITPELQADEVNRRISEPVEDPPVMPLAMGAIAEGDGYRLEGDWQRAGDGWRLAGGSGDIFLTFRAAEVHAVLAPASWLGSRHPEPADSPTIGLELDGGPPAVGRIGADVFRTSSGAGLRLDAPRLYNLIQDSTVNQHKLRLRFDHAGPTFYAFSFGSCLMPPLHPSS